MNGSAISPGHVREVLVIGGGLSGSSVAISLAQAGRDVMLIEKSAAAHPKVCGEFLSHEALHYVAALGIDVEALGAVPIESVRLAGDEVLATARLPFAARSLSRERLDEALLRRAANCGVHVLRRRRAQSLAEQNGLWTAATDVGETFIGRTAFLATGKHDLHGWNRPPGRQNDLLAFKMCWRLAAAQQAALDRYVELILFRGGYAGLQPTEGGMANLCLLVRKHIYKDAGGSWPALLAHMASHSAHLRRRLDGAIAVWERPLSLSSIPYGYVRTDIETGPWRLGDQSAVIPSFAGDGMSIALHSARLAAQMFVSGDSAGQYQKCLAGQVKRQIEIATLLSRVMVCVWARPLLSAVPKAWPGVMAQIATSTRIRAQDILPAFGLYQGSE